MLPVNMNM